MPNALIRQYAKDITDKKEYEVRRFTVNFKVYHGQLVANRAKELLRFEEWCPALPSVELKAFSYHEEKKELTFLFIVPTFMSDPKHGCKTLCDNIADLIATAINDVVTQKEQERLAKEDKKKLGNQDSANKGRALSAASQVNKGYRKIRAKPAAKTYKAIRRR